MYGSPRFVQENGENAMETIWDWLAIGAFAGLIVLFLQRSSMDQPPDTVWHYLPAAAGCAAANYLGNHDMGIFAAFTLTAVAVYVYLVLKPRITG